MSVLHELPLVSTIAIGLSTAFVCGFAANRIGLSPLLGYLLAGILIGPYSPGFVADIAIAEQLSEIGIVLLMFGVGLHFSISDFMEVRKIAAAGALVTIGLVTGSGYLLSLLWGWSWELGIIFGLCLSVASTVVVLRLLEETRLLQTITGKIAIGWLIVEDMAMIIALILIPSLGGDTGRSIVLDILLALGKLELFAAIMVIAGKRILPLILTIVSRTGSRELFTLAAFCMAMGIAFGASLLFGVSLALGAFFAGMMIRESDLNSEVADRILPFQDAFAVLFFVAIGMLFDPNVLIESPGPILMTVLIIIAGKMIIAFGVLRAFGYRVRTSLKIAAALAQIGEFSFILIALSSSLGLMSPEERSLILAGALISIAINPLLFRAVRRWCDTHDDPDIARSDALSHLSGDGSDKKLHALVIGYGRVGRAILSLVDANDIDLVILDANRERVRALRADGHRAIAGDATNAAILREAHIDEADAVLITIPDPFEARRVVEQVRSIKPDARIFVRSGNEEETAYYRSQKIEMVVSGTEEVAKRMISGLQTV